MSTYLSAFAAAAAAAAVEGTCVRIWWQKFV
jgi:hypothetical protein